MNVALIPARSGSKRIPHKNIKKLAGKPLIAYSILAAIESGCFDEIWVSTDSKMYGEVADEWGANVHIRPVQYATGTSPDIQWVFDAMLRICDEYTKEGTFSILRPTSPFRTGETIRRAYGMFEDCDSLRAVEKVKQHPGKMWRLKHGYLLPILPFDNKGAPWHSSQYQSLPEIYVQNASLEIARTEMMFRTYTIAGARVKAFRTEGYEGFDINTPEDWEKAEDIADALWG